MDAGDSEDLRVLDRAEADLEDVERALRRLDEGTYDRCEVCGGSIGDDRLARSPVTRRCEEHGAPASAASHPASADPAVEAQPALPEPARF
jgi:RNA polymerase-binding transcription factor DksA